MRLKSIRGNQMNIFTLSLWQWIWMILSAFLIGLSKTSISGFSMPVIPIIASVFGGKESTGIMLPMLIMGDIFALYYYNRHANLKDIKKLLPSALVGIILGAVVGNFINDTQFKLFIAISVLLCLALLIYIERKGDNFKIPKGMWFYSFIGVVAGFTSMIGNAAGPIFSVYLLAMGFKKENFLGTTAWFFFIINLSKLPLQMIFWNNITVKSVMLDFTMLPAIALGAFLGVVIIKRIKEKPFRVLIIVMTAFAAIRLLI